MCIYIHICVCVHTYPQLSLSLSLSLFPSLYHYLSLSYGFDLLRHPQHAWTIPGQTTSIFYGSCFSTD